MNGVFAAWLIVSGMAAPIPFESFQQCEVARAEIKMEQRWSPAAICIHGEYPPKPKQPGDAE